MALNPSPRKTVPLATGDGPRTFGHSRSDSAASTRSQTKRVFLCGVVVEGSEPGRRLPEEIEELVLSLGDVMGSENSESMLPSVSQVSALDRSSSRKRALTDSSSLTSVINELVSTEESYVHRLRMLKNDYADPLRSFSRNKNTAIIPAHEARVLFGNVDNILPVNEAFLADLKAMGTRGGLQGVGDVALKHFKELDGFELYKQYYGQRENAQAIFEKEVARRSSPFAEYIERIKYQGDSRNRVGLRELLMEPVQRVPRYTLLFRTIIKYMAPDDPQRAKIIEADGIASKIALAETDDQTKRAAVFYCLSTNIASFPPDLFSYSRHQFIDCIDVEDFLGDVPASSGASMSTSVSTSSTSASLHCTLFLFDDKLLIVKRPNSEKGGRALTGLEELDRMMKAGSLPNGKNPIGKKKSGLVCKGVVDLTDVVATDVGGADVHLYLETTPQDMGERWSGRPFRALSVVRPPAPVNLDPSQTEVDKQRFLQNLWTAQAKYRTRSGQSVVLQSDEIEVESRGGRATCATAYYNVYQRTAFLQENKKTKVVVHIDAQGTADRIPFGMDSPPHVVIKLQPLPGGVCRYNVTSSDPSDPGEEDIIQTTRVPSRIVLTIHQFGLFEFRTGRNNSRPSTPTAKSKASIFGLDAISRNLFNSRPASSMGEFFGGSVNSSKRYKSTASRSSVYTTTTHTTGDSLTKFSSRSGSSATTVDDDSSSFFSRSPKAKKLIKRGMSPGSLSEGERASPMSPASVRSRRRSKSASREPYSDEDEDEPPPLSQLRAMNPSDRDLAFQLALARRNSNSQKDRGLPNLPIEPSSEETIYEEEHDHLRPASRASRDSESQYTITPSNAGLESPVRQSRSLSVHSSTSDRPRGPRSPSPLPSRSAHMRSHEDGNDIFSPADPAQSTPTTTRSTGIPRSKRQPFYPTGNTHTEATPKPTQTNGLATNHTGSSTIEPLSIKKKSSVRSSTFDAPPSPTPARRNYATKNSPLVRPGTLNNVYNTPTRQGSPPSLRGRQPLKPMGSITSTTADDSSSSKLFDILQDTSRLAVSTREDVESSYRAVKRIKLEVATPRPSSQAPPPGEISRPSSPVKGLRPVGATPTTPMSKAAQDRLDEMRQLIGQRDGHSTPLRARSLAELGTPTQATQSFNDSSHQDFVRTLGTLVTEADKSLTRALSKHESLDHSLQLLSSAYNERSKELDSTKLELANARRQTEVIKSLLDDATTEKEIMFDAFNEELDAMYNDANMPDDEAWAAMSTDLKTTKVARNALQKENGTLKQRLAEMELKQQEWAVLLRAHGLIP